MPEWDVAVIGPQRAAARRGLDGDVYDVAVIGAGAVGAATARALALRGLRVVVLEKESAPALHQSSRNSGVVHAGYNLKPGSAKARFCVEGSRRLRAYCREKGVAVEEGGILIVARTEAERTVLKELDARSRANGVAAKLVDESGIRAIEPHAAGVEALHAPEGASFDAEGFVHAVVEDAQTAGAKFLYGTRVRSIQELPSEARLVTTKGPVGARVVVNAAGLFADRLAGELAPDVRIVPFRGYYAELVPARRALVRSHVYAAPDLAFPFLGVHLSRRFDGRVIVGPGAMLAFGREAYSFWGVNPRDLASSLAWPGFWRFLARPRVPGFVRTEVAKSLSLGAIAREAALLVPDVGKADLVRSYAGNRAQMIARDGALVDDILVRETERCVHVLNAVSPGLTCSLPFGEHLAERAGTLLA